MNSDPTFTATETCPKDGMHLVLLESEPGLIPFGLR